MCARQRMRHFSWCSSPTVCRDADCGRFRRSCGQSGALGRLGCVVMQRRRTVPEGQMVYFCWIGPWCGGSCRTYMIACQEFLLQRDICGIKKVLHTASKSGDVRQRSALMGQHNLATPLSEHLFHIVRRIVSECKHLSTSYGRQTTPRLRFSANFLF